MSKVEYGKLALIGLMSLAVIGCSTTYGRQNDHQNIYFSSNVAATSVSCGGNTIEAPGNISLRQSNTHTCTATADGFETKTFRVRSKVTKEGWDHSTKVNWDKWGKWTLGIGNLIGWPIDLISGSMRGFDKDRYDIELAPEGTSGTGKKILQKTARIGQAIIEMPKELTDETTNTVLDSTLRTSAQQVGITSDDKRKKVEDKIEGKKLLERLDEKYGDAQA